MSACISDALAQLRLAHPQWGWAVAGEEIKGKNTDPGPVVIGQAAARASVVRQGEMWCATIEAGSVPASWVGLDEEVVSAFNRARNNAGGRW